MEKSPLVSVCIPAYNAAEFIRQTVDCLLHQSYQNIEIIIVDDGSTDNTLDCLRVYRNHKNVKVLSQENKGQCAAANAAFNASCGELIKFMDADDMISNDFISDQVNRLNGRTDAVVSAAWGRFFGDDLATFQLSSETVWKDMKPMDWLVESLWNGPNMMQCALWLIPAAVLKRSGLWNETLSLINDFDFFIRVLLAGNEVLFAQNAILFYRSGVSHSLSAQKSRKAFESAYQSIKLGVEHILSYEDTERTRKISSDSFQLWKYQFYPMHKDLYELCEKQIKILGGSQFPFPAGGKTRKLSKLIGWKLTRRLLHLQNAFS